MEDIVHNKLLRPTTRMRCRRVAILKWDIRPASLPPQRYHTHINSSNNMSTGSHNMDIYQQGMSGLLK